MNLRWNFNNNLLSYAILLSIIFHGMAVFYMNSKNENLFYKVQTQKVNHKVNASIKKIENKTERIIEALETKSQSKESNTNSEPATVKNITKNNSSNIVVENKRKKSEVSKSKTIAPQKVNEIQNIENENDSQLKSIVKINESTKDYRYAQYFESWKSKVEKIGAMNYPQEIEKALLIVSVIINSDGSIYSSRIVKSSGNKLADDNALQTINMAAPFARFPPELAKETKLMEITKTWSYNKSASTFQ